MRISDWSSDLCSSDLYGAQASRLVRQGSAGLGRVPQQGQPDSGQQGCARRARLLLRPLPQQGCCVTALTSSIPAFDHDELIQSHPVATLLIDRGGVVLFVNAAAEQLCNLSRSAMVGRVVYDVIRMDRGYRQRMRNPATSALFAHRTAIAVGARKAT